MLGTRSQVRAAAMGEAVAREKKRQAAPAKIPNPVSVKKKQPGLHLKRSPPQTKGISASNQSHNLARTSPRHIPAQPASLVTTWLANQPTTPLPDLQSPSEVSEVQSSWDTTPWLRESSEGPASQEVSPSPTMIDTTAATSKRADDYRATLRNHGIKLLRQYESLPADTQALIAEFLPQEPIATTGRENKEIIEWMEDSGEMNNARLLFQKRMHAVLSKVGSHSIIAESFLAKSNQFRSDDVPVRGALDPLSPPRPDAFWGYQQRSFAFELQTLAKRMDNHVLMFPFLLFQQKKNVDETAGHGGLWGPTNHCLLGSATFLNIINKFKAELCRRSLTAASAALPSVVFSVASDGALAILYVTTSHSDGSFEMSLVRPFTLFHDCGQERLERYLERVIAWGAGERLARIQAALRALQLSQSGEDVEMAGLLENRQVPERLADAEGDQGMTEDGKSPQMGVIDLTRNRVKEAPLRSQHRVTSVQLQPLPGSHRAFEQPPPYPPLPGSNALPGSIQAPRPPDRLLVPRARRGLRSIHAAATR